MNIYLRCFEINRKNISKEFVVMSTECHVHFIVSVLLCALVSIGYPVWTLETGMDRGIVHCYHDDKTKIRVEKGDFGTIETQNVTGNGTSKSGCSVEIRACSTCKVHLRLMEIDFPECQSPRKHRTRPLCISGCDHIQIHEADEPYASISRQNVFSQEDLAQEFVSISANVIVKYCHASGSIQGGRSFKLQFEVTEKREMRSGTVTSMPFMKSTGQLTSPNFPEGYALNGDIFTYTLQNLDPYGYVRLVFDDWLIAPESSMQIFDGVDMSSAPMQLNQGDRPVIVSQTSTLIIIFHTGRRASTCCQPVGFKLSYKFVSSRQWLDKPQTDCGDMITAGSGGNIRLSSLNVTTPAILDCVWIIKRPLESEFTGLKLQITDIIKGKGWHDFTDSRLEIHEGFSSESPQLGYFVADNLTDTSWVTTGEGFYIRLRAVLHRRDNINIVYTLVTNGTDDGCSSSSQYLCHNQWCIDNKLMCDHTDHCGDNSDESPELICSIAKILKIEPKWTRRSKPPTTVHPCGHGGFRCPADNLCIPMANICDGYMDCQDRSDEIYCAYYQQNVFSSARANHAQVCHLVMILLSLLWLSLITTQIQR